MSRWYIVKKNEKYCSFQHKEGRVIRLIPTSLYNQIREDAQFEIENEEDKK